MKEKCRYNNEKGGLLLKYSLYPILIDKLKEIYGLNNENTNYLYKYLSIRACIYHNKRKISDRELFNFMIDELNLTVFDNEEGLGSSLIYKDEKYSLFQLSSEVIQNFKFRADLEGDINYKNDLEDIFRKGYQRAYKYRGLPSYKSHLMLERLKALNLKFGANPTSSQGIEGFSQGVNHNPFKRTLEERLEAELASSKHSETKSTSYITENKLEDYLVDNLHLIEDGLQFMSRQVDVPGGVIDILAKDKDNNICVIEIKIKEDKSLIWQTIHYPTQIRNKYNRNVRMITIAPEYSKPIYDALKSVGNIEMYSYDITVASENIKNLRIHKVS